MTSSSDGQPGIGELQRALQAVLVRFETLATKMDTQFVQKENFNVWQRLFDETIHGIRDTLKVMGEARDSQATKEDITLLRADHDRDFALLRSDLDKKASKGQIEDVVKDVTELQDDKKWLQRVIYGFIVIAILGALFVRESLGGG